MSHLSQPPHHLLIFIIGLSHLIAASAFADPADQTPKWSKQDADFFLHGSLGTEVVPQHVLDAFIATYPDLFPGGADLSVFGLINEAATGLPVGISRRQADHLAKLPALGINCAACHVAEIAPATDPSARVRILGVTSHFDAEAWFGAIILATFRTAEPANMERFLPAFLADSSAEREKVAELVKAQHEKIAATIAVDPTGGADIAAGQLHTISPDDLRNQQDLTKPVRALLQLFHNMRAALHVPDKPSTTPPPPPSGPGRNDAFGLLSLVLFGVPTEAAPVKYGLVWNLDQRAWVHWDGNTRSPLGRNILAALGLGAPLVGKEGKVDLALIGRHTDLSEQIRPPKYPWKIDADAAKAGQAMYQNRCASCHDIPADQEQRRLFAIDEIKTDPARARQFAPRQADLFNNFFTELKMTGYEPPKEPPIRSTQKYWAADLAGVWARAPYLHNGSAPTMMDLLTAPADRPKTFHRGSRLYDTEKMGYTDAGPYVLDTTKPGNSNAGHDYGADLSPQQKRQLIEYLKTR